MTSYAQKRRQQTEAEQVMRKSRIEGIGNFYIRKDDPTSYKTVHFLTPYPNSIDLPLHKVRFGREMKTFLCDKFHNADPMAECSVCEYADSESDAKAKLAKHFLVYIYDNANIVPNINDKKPPVLAVLEVRAGSIDQTHFKQLEKIHSESGLTNQTITITNVKNSFINNRGETVEFQTYKFTPDYNKRGKLDMNLIPEEVRNVIPTIIEDPGFDIVSEAVTTEMEDLMDKWAEFFINSQGYLYADKFTAPKKTYANEQQPYIPGYGQPVYASPMTQAPAPMVGGYQPQPNYQNPYQLNPASQPPMMNGYPAPQGYVPPGIVQQQQQLPPSYVLPNDPNNAWENGQSKSPWLE